MQFFFVKNIQIEPVDKSIEKQSNETKQKGYNANLWYTKYYTFIYFRGAKWILLYGRLEDVMIFMIHEWFVATTTAYFCTPNTYKTINETVSTVLESKNKFKYQLSLEYNGHFAERLITNLYILFLLPLQSSAYFVAFATPDEHFMKKEDEEIKWYIKLNRELALSVWWQIDILYSLLCQSERAFYLK